MNAAHASAPSLGRASGFPASAFPELHRSEAFVEDLFDTSSFAPERGAQPEAARQGRWSTVLLCALPLMVAVLGGVMVFFHSVG